MTSIGRHATGRAKIRIQTVSSFAQAERVNFEEIRPAAWQRRFWYAALTALAVVALVAVFSGVILLVVRAAAFLQPLLIPVVAAVILTYLLTPVVDKLCSFGLRRTSAVVVLFGYRPGAERHRTLGRSCALATDLTIRPDAS